MESSSRYGALELDESLCRRIDALARAEGVTPAEIIRKALNETSHLHPEARERASSDAILTLARRISSSVPAEIWKEVPRDLAENFDHYHYGHPRED